MNRRAWTTEEVDLLHRRSASSPLRELAAELGRPVKMVRWKIKQLELPSFDARTLNPGRTVTVWTQAKLDYLRKNAPTHTAAEMAETLGISERQIRRGMYGYSIAGRGQGAPRPAASTQAIKDKARIRLEAKYPPEGPWVCLTCGLPKALTEYHDSTSSRPSHVCRACWRSAHLLRTFDLTPEAYDTLLTAQGGVCAICENPETRRRADGEPFALAVDHDHSCCPGKKTCGKCVRGLLCWECNNVIGKIEGRVGDLSRLAAYLSQVGGPFGFGGWSRIPRVSPWDSIGCVPSGPQADIQQQTPGGHRL